MSNVTFNINYYVKVKLTDYGRDTLAKKHGGKIPEWYKDYTDSEGWIKFQLWDLMSIFGSFMSMGDKLLFETKIKIDKNYLGVSE